MILRPLRKCGLGRNSGQIYRGIFESFDFYLFQVSVEDYGEYRLAIRYVTFPGIRYVIFFDIEQEPLPNITTSQ